MSRTILTLVIFLMIIVRLPAQYLVNEQCLTAWEQLMDLKTENAKKTLQQEINRHPTNYYAYYLDQTVDFIAMLIFPADSVYSGFETKYLERREIMDERETSSPYYQACESEMMLEMAIANALYGDKYSAVRRGYKSYKLTNRNLEEHPGFGMSGKVKGFFDIAIANLPPFVRWAVSFLGVKGNEQKGFQSLIKYYEQQQDIPGLNAEAALYIVNSYKLEKNPSAAYAFMQTLDSSVMQYRLVKYFYANVAYRSGHNEVAYQTLRDFDPKGVEMIFIPYDYMMGRVLMRKLDTSAIRFFDRYLRLTENDNYKKEVYNYVSLFWLINGDKQKYEQYKKLTYEEGQEVQERDREAMYDCQLDYTPDVALTKARLLMEGGYYKKASPLLNGYSFNTSTILPHKLAYYLLKGKYEDHAGKIRRAISNYKKVIDLGNDEDYYFAADAALRLGLIYKNTDRQQAIIYFEKARDLYDSDYYEYIDDIAKKQLALLTGEN